jgi:hydroxylaminobenzene mutase
MDPSTPRRLMFHGMLLFLLGLLTGFAVPSLANPRMGLTAHLEGLMNGTFLAVVGLVWTHLRVSPRAATVAFWLLLYAAYANWASTTLAALWGTGALAPIAAPGRSGAAWQEAIVTFGLISLSVAIVPAVGILLAGLRSRARG